MANMRARHLRSNMTEAEKRLWKKLRELNRRGHHFRRQAPLGAYIVDFCSHNAKLVIEVDGGQHNSDEGVALDRARTAALEQAGYRVLRFWNNDVMKNVDGVMDSVLRLLNDPHPCPSPQGGGGPS